MTTLERDLLKTMTNRCETLERNNAELLKALKAIAILHPLRTQAAIIACDAIAKTKGD